MNLTNYNQIEVSEEIERWNSAYLIEYVEYEKSKLKINADFILRNLYLECYREQLVSFLGMFSILEDTVKLNEADYILYMHPYARVEDASKRVLFELNWINVHRKEGAEIIVLGKSANAKEQLNGDIKNITFWGDHFAQKLGNKFGLDIKERYFVYDDRFESLNIWPVDGCLQKCAFCRRSYMEIKFESIPLDTIKENLDFLKKVAPEKLRTISLRAENLTEYGIDIYGNQKLDELLNLINSYDEVENIEFPIGLSIGEITSEILDALCKCKNINLIAMNLEVGSNRMLKFIGKKHTRESAIQIFQKIKKYHPKAQIYTTVMIGLPTEELIDIYELADLIIKAEPNNVLCNFYGIAPRQPLAKFPQLSETLREYHLKILMKLLKNKIDLEFEYYHIFKNKSSKTTLLAKKEMEEHKRKTGLGIHFSDIILLKKKIS